MLILIRAMASFFLAKEAYGAVRFEPIANKKEERLKSSLRWLQHKGVSCAQAPAYDPIELIMRDFAQTCQSVSIQPQFLFGLPSQYPQLTRDYGKDAFANVVPEIYESAKKIIALENTEKGNDAFVFLGRTPQWIYEAILSIKAAQKKTSDHFVSLNYSGTPDIEFIREHQSEHNYKNLMTEAKFSFYRRYMKDKGLDLVRGRLFIVDIIGAGAGLNSFLRILKRFYELEKAPFPDVYFVSLNMSDDPQEAADHGWTYEASHKMKGGHVAATASLETGLLRYELSAAKLQNGFVPLSVDTLAFAASPKLCEFLDEPLYQYLYSPGISFPASLWSNTAVNAHQRQGGPRFKKAQAVFQHSIRSLIAQDRSLRQL